MNTIVSYNKGSEMDYKENPKKTSKKSINQEIYNQFRQMLPIIEVNKKE
jgi:hypothetical protein